MPESSDSDEAFLLLVVRYFEGDLDETETAALNARLRADPMCRRRFADYAIGITLIRETLDAERQGVARDAPAEVRDPSRTMVSPSHKRRVLLAGAAALSAVAAVIAILLWPTARDSEVARPVVVAVVEPVIGEVTIVAADGNIRTALGRTDLYSGEAVRTEPLSGEAAVVYTDGSRLTLIGETLATFSMAGGKRVDLKKGTVRALVAPQPAGEQLVLTTPAARIEVRGTVFTCQALPDRTDVSVTSGSIRVVRRSDSQEVDVKAGQRVMAAPRADLVVEAIPERPGTWELDFEAGLPADMHRGRFVTNGLPRGSKGGVAAVRSTDAGLEGYFEIATPERWQHGLFAFHPDSHLHVTYTLTRPQWVNGLVIARGAGPNGRHVGNYLFNDGAFFAPARVGRWQTVTIPLSLLRRTGTTDGSGPRSDEFPYLVVFSSDGERGLVIDRLWVTRGGPGVVQYQDLE